MGGVSGARGGGGGGDGGVSGIGDPLVFGARCIIVDLCVRAGCVKLCRAFSEPDADAD